MRMQLLLLSVLTTYQILAGHRYPPVPVCEAMLSTNGIRHVQVAGRVTAAMGNVFIVRDNTGSVAISHHSSDTNRLSVGDCVSVDMEVRGYGKDKLLHYVDQVRVLHHGDAASPVRRIRLSDLRNGTFEFEKITFDATVTDVFIDEIDPSFTILTLEDGNGATDIAVRANSMDILNWRRLIDTPVSITGICLQSRSGSRRHLSHHVHVDPKTSVHPLSPSEMPENANFPKRTEHRGVVLAFYDPETFYLKTDDGRRLKVYMAADATAPDVGDMVKVSGFVRQNIFFDFLTNATVEGLGAASCHPEDPTVTTPRTILYDKLGQRMIKPSLDGHAIRITGTVRNALEIGTPNGKITLDCDGIAAAVRIGAMKPPPIGSIVETTGICAIESESGGRSAGFVRLTGFTLLTRSAKDIKILRTPPWWTPFRLTMLVIVLTIVLLSSALGNIILRRKSEKRGKELYDERIGHALAEQKVEERTRLAVELHDSVSQTLTGIALQLDGGEVETAKAMLASCRGELRRCLWDLRSRTFEEKDMTEAVTRTITPHLNGCAASVRFNVPREQLSESLTHAILRIIRELVVNAIRHGQAKHVRIAGEMHDDTVSFSVTDDGHGFDPETAPGPGQGHFGLLGIRERIEDFNGNLKIASTPNHGAKFTVMLTATDESNEQD